MVYLLGGLAADSDQPMSDQMRRTLVQIWLRIESELGTEFNFDFWRDCQPRRSTYCACRAVIASEILAGEGAAVGMIEAIQKGYYLRAMNPSDESMLITLAEELQLDGEAFRRALQDDATHIRLCQQIALARSLPIAGFPSLVLQTAQGLQPVTLDYRDHNVSLEHIESLLAINSYM